MDDHSKEEELILLTNEKQKERFLSVPYGERILFMSHCIRADLREEIRTFAENLGYKVHVVGGGSIVLKMIAKEKPGAVVGIACPPEIQMAVEKIDQPLQIVLLDTDGCKDTLVDVEEAKRVLGLYHPPEGKNFPENKE